MATASAPLPARSDRTRLLAVPVLATLAQMLMMIPGYTEDGDFQTGEFLGILLVSLLVGLAVFWLVVPGAGSVAAVVLSVVALATVVVFWAGLTLPLAAAGGLAAWRNRSTGQRPGLATVALVIAALAAVALVVTIIGDATSS